MDELPPCPAEMQDGELSDYVEVEIEDEPGAVPLANEEICPSRPGSSTNATLPSGRVETVDETVDEQTGEPAGDDDAAFECPPEGSLTPGEWIRRVWGPPTPPSTPPGSPT